MEVFSGILLNYILMSSQYKTPYRLINLWIAEKTVVLFIIINAIALFLDSFPSLNSATHGILTTVDEGCTFFFLVEIFFKVYAMGSFRAYWRDNWNRFDFIVVILSLPSLVIFFFDFKALSAFLVLRLSRLFKFFRLLRFTPHGMMIWEGIIRSLKASVSIFLALFLLNFLFAMGATILFGELVPEYFGNPIISAYSMFKVFTIEGWYDVPDMIYERSGYAAWGISIRIYYMVAVMIGGILGLSLANAVFVDEMTADNTNQVENMVENLAQEFHQFKEEVQTEQLRLLENVQMEVESIRELLIVLQDVNLLKDDE